MVYKIYFQPRFNTKWSIKKESHWDWLKLAKVNELEDGDQSSKSCFYAKRKYEITDSVFVLLNIHFLRDETRGAAIIQNTFSHLIQIKKPQKRNMTKIKMDYAKGY